MLEIKQIEELEQFDLAQVLSVSSKIDDHVDQLFAFMGDKHIFPVTKCFAIQPAMVTFVLLRGHILAIA